MLADSFFFSFSEDVGLRVVEEAQNGMEQLAWFTILRLFLARLIFEDALVCFLGAFVKYYEVKYN